MIAHKLLTAVIFTLIVGGLTKLSQSDEKFLRRLSKLTLSEVKSEYQIKIQDFSMTFSWRCQNA